MRRQRGLMFTIVTFLLLGSVLAFTAFYMDTSVKAGARNYALSGEKAMALDSDISESCLDCLDSELYYFGKNADGLMEIEFQPFIRISESQSYDWCFQRLEELLNGTFARLTQNRISTDIEPGFRVIPYNISLVPAEPFNLTTGRPDLLFSIRIEMTVDQQDFALNTTSIPPGDSDGRTVTVVVRDPEGSPLLSSSVPLSISEANEPFRANFNDGSYIAVYFGAYPDQGTLTVDVSGLAAETDILEMKYQALSNVFMEPMGNYNLTSGGLTRSRVIIGAG